MITAQIETLANGLEELKPLLPVHWEELALNQDEVPLDPQYEEYLKRERLGMVLYVTLRKSGKLIGYFVGFVAPGMHYKTCLTLTMDIFYIYPDHRGDGGGLILFNMVKREAKRRGVQRWFVGNKEHANFHATRLFEAMGFQKIETYYSMMLGD